MTKKALSREGIVLAFLGVVLVAGIVVGAIRHSRRGKISIEAVPEEPLIININQANAEKLTLLPGIGPALASRIVEYRDEHGDFLNPESLLNVSGIGQVKLGEIKPYLQVP